MAYILENAGAEIDIAVSKAHDESHVLSSHSDTSATGAQLDELVGGEKTTLHTHDIDCIPAQTGQSGKYLSTDGITIFWAPVPQLSIGTTAGTACEGNDTRLSNSRKCNNTFDDAATSRTNLGLGSKALGNQTISTSDPSGGSSGDVWYKI